MINLAAVRVGFLNRVGRFQKGGLLAEVVYPVFIGLAGL